MIEPRRWRDAGSGAPAEVGALLDAAEPPVELPGAVRMRGRRRVAQRRKGIRDWLMIPSGALSTAVFAVASVTLGLLSVERMPRADIPVELAAVQSPPSSSEPAGEASAPTSTAVARRHPRAPRELAPPPVAVAQRVGAVQPARLRASADLRQRWRQQRWANEARRSRQRIEATVDAILKPEAQLLARAGDEVGQDPAQALSLIDSVRRSHANGAVPAPSVVVEIDALRRLGRFEDALALARGLVRTPRKEYYADEMRERFAFIEL